MHNRIFDTINGIKGYLFQKICISNFIVTTERNYCLEKSVCKEKIAKQNLSKLKKKSIQFNDDTSNMQLTLICLNVKT